MKARWKYSFKSRNSELASCLKFKGQLCAGPCLSSVWSCTSRRNYRQIFGEFFLILVFVSINSLFTRLNFENLLVLTLLLAFDDNGSLLWFFPLINELFNHFVHFFPCQSFDFFHQFCDKPFKSYLFTLSIDSKHFKCANFPYFSLTFHLTEWWLLVGGWGVGWLSCGMFAENWSQVGFSGISRQPTLQ